MILTLYHGHTYNELVNSKDRKHKYSYPHRQDYFEEERIIMELSGFEFQRTDEKLFRQNYQMLNIDQLQYAVDSLDQRHFDRRHTFNKNLDKTYYFKKEIKDTARIAKLKKTEDPYAVQKINFDSTFTAMSLASKLKVVDVAMNYARTTKTYVQSSAENLHAQKRWIRRHEIEWHKKFTLSFACFILFFIGAPLGAIIRKGGIGMPTVVSVLFFILYYIISITGEKYVRSGVLEASQGMWISSFILLPLGIFLTYKATTDSVILNIDTYFTFFKKVFGIELTSSRDLDNQQ